MKHLTQVWAHYFKLLNRVQPTQDEKARFIKGNELKLTQVELFSFFFLREYHYLPVLSRLLLILILNKIYRRKFSNSNFSNVIRYFTYFLGK